MPLPSQPNASIAIYRGFNGKAPYPPDGTPAAAANVPAVLKHHMKNGRMGYRADGLHWTHLLYVDEMVDIRSAYDAHMTRGGNPNWNKTDTVLIGNYPNAGKT